MDRWDYQATLDPADDRLAAIISESGRHLRSRERGPVYEDRFDQFHELYLDTIEGRRDTYWLREALSTSDFPILMGDILDRQLLANYQEWPAVWPNFAKRGTVRDFRQVRRIALDGLEGRYIPTYLKPELTEVREDQSLSETGYTYSVDVYEKAVTLNWRMLVNDDLDAFSSIPTRLARGARRTEDFLATSLFVASTGPNATFYSNTNKNLVNTTNGASTNNPPLSITGLQDAMVVLSGQVDGSGEPVFTEMVVLVVPPALEVVANNIINATIARISAGAQGGATGVELEVANWMSRRVKVVVNPYIPVIDTSANKNKGWYLFADPGVGRPAIEMGFLRGMEGPQLFQKAANTQRIGGGVDPMLGDFDTNEIRYKGMEVLGGTLLDPKASVASNGSGT